MTATGRTPGRARLGALLGAAVLTLAGTYAGGADRDVGVSEVVLSGCHLGLVELLDDSDRLAPFVRDPFHVAEFYGPGTGALSLWHFSCEAITVEGGAATPGQLVLASVQIDPPGGDGWPTYVVRPDEELVLYYLNTFDFYLHAAYSDHPQLVRNLRRAGLPVELVRDLDFDRRPRVPDPTEAMTDPAQLNVTSTSVPSRHGPFGFEVRPPKQHPHHDHDNSWWYSSAHHGHIRLRLRLVDAIDKWCSYGSPDCASVWAEGETARLLGGYDHHAARGDGLGIDHDRIERGVITIARSDGHHR